MKGNVGFHDYTPLYAEELVLKFFPINCKRVLDFGCGNGHFTKQLIGRAKEVCACDVDKAHIINNKKESAKIKYELISIGKKTSYKDRYFDCITLMGVLEHVPDEDETLQEVNRILASRGVVFIYVHNKGLLRFLDAANLKYRFPRFHRLMYLLFYGRKAYEKEFVEKKKYGLVGDTTATRQWHTHYSIGELKNFTNEYFSVEKVWYHSFFFPLLLTSEFIYISIFKKRNKFISWLITIDNKINLGPLSYSVVIQCRKRK
jgi:SAM-dependent methyltransferase